MLRNLFKTDTQQLIRLEESVQPVPWTEESFKTCFQAGHLGWVIELEKEVIGFILISLRAEECHVLNLCVARAHQRQGFGKQLLDHVLNYAKEQGAGVIYLEVRQSNAKAISLYRKRRFYLIGTRKDYYPTVSGYEDALVFARSLSA